MSKSGRGCYTGSGRIDPTAYTAIKNICKEQKAKKAASKKRKTCNSESGKR